MASCAVCGDEITGTQAMKCDDCQKVYCREHFHSHDCDPVKTENTNDHSPSAESTTVSVDPIRIGTYVLTVPAGAIGVVYFIDSLNVVINGGNAIESISAIASLVIATAFFAFGAFVLAFATFLMD